MKIKLFVLQRTALFREVRELRRIVARAFPDAPEPIYATDDYQLLLALQQRIGDCEVILVAADAERAAGCRKRLLRAMEIPAVPRMEVLNRQADPRPEEACFPQEAVLFLTWDGEDTGFALRRQEQCLIFLPLRLASLAEFGPALHDYLDQLRPAEGIAGPLALPDASILPDASEAFDKISVTLGSAEMISPEAIVPFRSEDAYYSNARSRGSASVPLAEIVDLNQRRVETAEAVRRLLRRAEQLKGKRCFLALPDEWREIATLLRELQVASAIQPVLLAPESEVLSAEDAVRCSKRILSREPGALCGVISSPLPKQDGRKLIYLAAGSAQEYAQVRQLELDSGESPAECAACAAEALLTLLWDHLGAQGLPPRAASIVALRETEARAASNRGRRQRAATAFGLILATFAATAYLTMQSPMGSALREPTAVTQVFEGEEPGGSTDVIDPALLGEAQNAALRPVYAAMLEPATIKELQAALEAPASGDLLEAIQKIFRTGGSMVMDLLRQLWDYIQAGLPKLIPETTTASTTSTASAATTTSKATTTTAKPATTAQTTTQTTTTAKPTTTSPPTTVPLAQGAFRFNVRGYGHAVGMSQEGAKAYALQGWSAKDILLHYYNASKMTVEKDAKPPTNVKHEGVSYLLTEYLARVTCGEIGYPNRVADEAFKAQVICAYTVAKRTGFNTTENNQHIVPTATWNGSYETKQHAKAYELVNAVLGQYLAHDGAAAETLYFASCAGRTTNAAYVWGGTAKPYLQGGRESIEAVDATTKTFTQDEIRAYVAAYNKSYPGKAITLGSDPAAWFGDITRDSGGYIQTMRVGNQTLIGGEVRSKLFGSKVIRSHCFEVEFTPAAR